MACKKTDSKTARQENSEAIIRTITKRHKDIKNQIIALHTIIALFADLPHLSSEQLCLTTLAIEYSTL